MLRPRKRAAGLLLGAGVLFFLGSNVQAGWLFVLAAFLIGAVVAGVVLPGRMLRGLNIERRASDLVNQNDEALLHLVVTNHSRGLRLSILVQDPFLSETTIFLPSIAPGESVEVTTSRRALRRGWNGPSDATMRTVAPFGMAERRRRVPVEGRTLVLPMVVPLGNQSFIEPVSTNDHAIHSLPRVGRGPEYLGVREYRPGDSMRHVHWPSTARTGTVMVREFEQETTRRMAIIVDSSRDAGDRWTPLDRCCCAAASIALAAKAHGHGARLVLAEEGRLDVLSRAGDGELLERLALLDADSRLPFATLLAGLGGGELRGVETVVLVLPTWRENDSQALTRPVGDLVERFSRVIVLLVDASEGSPKTAALSEAAMNEVAEDLTTAGAEVHVWRSGTELADVLDRSWGSVVAPARPDLPSGVRA
ncbi:MAG: DUF58 domain-containing protein [Actinomycetota bacterium]|nr:DUF58 domain-containing protein [Actinomycetota bacterium]